MVFSALASPPPPRSPANSPSLSRRRSCSRVRRRGLNAPLLIARANRGLTLGNSESP